MVRILLTVAMATYAVVLHSREITDIRQDEFGCDVGA